MYFRILFFLLLFVQSNIIAQEYKNIDSLILAYNNHKKDTSIVELSSLIIQNLTYTNPKLAVKYAHEMINISKKFNYQNGIALGYNNLGSCFSNKDELDSALFYKKATLKIVTKIQNIGGILTANMGLGILYNKKNNFGKAKEYLNKNIFLFENRDTIKNAREKDFKYIGSTYHQLSEVYLRKGQYNLALKNQLRALELYKERAKDPLFEADAYTSLGLTEMKMANYKQSIVYYKEALKVYQEFKDLLWESDVLRFIGENLVLQNKPNEAINYLLSSIKIANKNNFKLIEASAYNHLGNAYIYLNQYQKALQSFEKSVGIFDQMDNPTEINKTYINLGILYNKMSQPLQAITFLDKAIVISDSIKEAHELYDALFHRSQSYGEIKDYKLALKDFVLFNKLKDSIFTVKKSQQIEELRTIFETEKKEAAIASQKEEIKTLNVQAKNDKLTKTLYGFGMFSVIVIAGLIYFSFKQRIKKNKIEREKQEEIYKQKIAFKKKELACQTLHLVKKNTFIQELKENLAKIKQSPELFKIEFRRLVMLLKKESAEDKDWEVFKSYFSEVYNDFDQKIKTLANDISEKEIRLASFLRMNLTTKEIASMLNVLPDSVLKSKYRLKKKLGLNKKQDLNTFLNSL